MPNADTNIKVTLGDLVDYILKNRGSKVFQGWTEEQIAFECYRAALDQEMLYATDETEKHLIGVVLARKLIDPDTNEKVMGISAALTTKKGVLANFFLCFRKMYPNYKLMQATRRKKRGGKRVIYYKNLDRFQQLLTNIH